VPTTNAAQGGAVWGTVAITDRGWYQRLWQTPGLDEVNFWKPSATTTFHADEFSPFLFKLRSSDGNAICGFGLFARYSRLPDWLAWEAFGVANGCASLEEMRDRIHGIRDRIRYRGTKPSEIGCILIVQPIFFPPDRWIAAPRDWSPRTQTNKRYDLEVGEGARVWNDCLAAADRVLPAAALQEPGPRYGSPSLIVPRLGQGTFRVAVTDAYGRGCTVTEEHSLPVLEAAHIKPYHLGGPHEVGNGLLLRADLHRLFDQGYVTVTPDLRLEVGQRLREEFSNGRTYYPFHGQRLRPPAAERDRPNRDNLAWHNENVYVG
jgi:putative restriction endonuclease